MSPAQLIRVIGMFVIAPIIGLCAYVLIGAFYGAIITRITVFICGAICSLIKLSEIQIDRIIKFISILTFVSFLILDFLAGIEAAIVTIKTNHVTINY